MGRFDDQVVFISGEAQTHRRSQALAFAREGADVALFHLVNGSAPWPDDHVPTAAELEATRREIEATGRRCLVLQGDARDSAQLDAAIDRTVRELGRLDLVVARAGVFCLAPSILRPSPGS